MSPSRRPPAVAVAVVDRPAVVDGARRPRAATSAASAARRSSARAVRRVRASRRSRGPARGGAAHRRRGDVVGLRRTGTSRSSPSPMSSPKTSLTHSMTGTRAEVGGQLDDAAALRPNRSRRRGRWRCRPGGSGRSTASGRRRRTGARARPATSSHGSVAGRRLVGVGGGDAHGELDLDRVGVLELVEQQPLVAAVQRPARRGRARGRAAGRGRGRAGRGTRAGRRRAARAAPSG